MPSFSHKARRIPSSNVEFSGAVLLLLPPQGNPEDDPSVNPTKGGTNNCFTGFINVNSNANLNSEWTALETSRNCDYFRGNPEDDQSMNPRKRGIEEGDQSEGNPKREI